MPGRKYAVANTKYRYGFNGKENDNDVKGDGNQQDYGFRIYDPRLGRFLSEDPITKDYPELTPYQFASNTPIQAYDLDGLEGILTGPWIINVMQGVSNWWSSPANTGEKVVGQGSAARLGYPDYIPDTKGDALLATIGSGLQDYNQYGTYYSSHGGQFGKLGVKNPQSVKEPATVQQKPILKSTNAKSETFEINFKTLSNVTKHLKQFGAHAENDVMLSRMQKIAKNEMKATEIDLNFAKHELREAELMKGGKMKYEEAHSEVLREQGMSELNVSEYEKKIYTKEALDAGNAAWEKEIKKK